jgi:hypothetical protein
MIMQNLNADVLNMSCFFRASYWTFYRIQVSFPFILLAVILVLASGIYVVTWIRNRDAFTQHKVATPFEKGLSVYLFLLTSLFVYQLSVAFAPFRCFPQIDGTYTMLPNPQENCFDTTWKRNSGVTAVALIEVIVIPLGLAALLYRYRNDRQSNFFEWRYSVLTRNYKDQFYWWEIFSMLRKAALVMIIDLTNGLSSYFRTYIVVLFLIVSMAVDSILRPYKFEGAATASNFMYANRFRIF